VSKMQVKIKSTMDCQLLSSLFFFFLSWEEEEQQNAISIIIMLQVEAPVWHPLIKIENSQKAKYEEPYQITFLAKHGENIY
jgi:hypothetical protein